MLWIGDRVADAEVIASAVSSHVRLVEKFEGATCQVTTVQAGQEPLSFWQLLGLSSGAPEEFEAFRAPRTAFDEDAETCFTLIKGSL